MCVATGKPPALVCTIGDLTAGQEYHDPNGERWMVRGAVTPANYRPQFSPDGEQVRDVMVVNIGNATPDGYNPYGLNGNEFKGRVTPVYADIKLGHDHKGRLYASTKLNDWYDRVLPLPTEYGTDAAADVTA